MKADIEIIQKFVECLNKSIPFDLKITAVNVNDEDIGDYEFAVFFGDKNGKDEKDYKEKGFSENWGYISKGRPPAGLWYFSYRKITPERRYGDGTGEPEWIEYVDKPDERWQDISDCIFGLLQYKLKEDFGDVYENFIMD